MLKFDFTHWLESSPRLIRLARRVGPDLAWNGSGTIVDKVFMPSASGAAFVGTGKEIISAAGSLAERKVLVLRDKKGKGSVYKRLKPRSG